MFIFPFLFSRWVDPGTTHLKRKKALGEKLLALTVPDSVEARAVFASLARTIVARSRPRFAIALECDASSRRFQPRRSASRFFICARGKRCGNAPHSKSTSRARRAGSAKIPRKLCSPVREAGLRENLPLCFGNYASRFWTRFSVLATGRSDLAQRPDHFRNDFNPAIDFRFGVESAERKAEAAPRAITIRIHCPQHMRRLGAGLCRHGRNVKPRDRVEFPLR